jgi:predicted metal-binding membrane protein
MLALGTLMAIEKNVRWGRRFGKPLGVALLGSALIVALTNTPGF